MQTKRITSARIERAEQNADRKLAAEVAAMSDERLEELTRDLVADYEAAHGPVEPKDFTAEAEGLRGRALDAFLSRLSDRDYVAWHKHDALNPPGGQEIDE